MPYCGCRGRWVLSLQCQQRARRLWSGNGNLSLGFEIPYMKDRDLQLPVTKKTPKLLFRQPLKKNGFLLRSFSLVQSVLILLIPLGFVSVSEVNTSAIYHLQTQGVFGLWILSQQAQFSLTPTTCLVLKLNVRVNISVY